MYKISFVKPSKGQACYSLDELGNTCSDLIVKDGFAIALSDTPKGIMARTFIEVANGVYEQAQATDHIRDMVQEHTGINTDNYETGSSLDSKKNAVTARKKANEYKAPIPMSGAAHKEQQRKHHEQQKAAKTTERVPEVVKPVSVAPVKPEKVTTSNADIQKLLTQCVGVIEELNGHISAAQVEGKPLKFYTDGSQYRSVKARAQLEEQGLIKRSGKGWLLTHKGLDAKIATYTRSTETNTQVLRYLPEVSKYIDLKEPQGLIEKQVGSFIMVDPDGKEHVVNGVTAFARSKGLEKSKIYLCRKKMLKSTKGWRYLRDC